MVVTVCTAVFTTKYRSLLPTLSLCGWILNRLWSPRPSPHSPPLARPLIGWLCVTCSPIGQLRVNIVTLSQLILCVVNYRKGINIL